MQIQSRHIPDRRLEITSPRQIAEVEIPAIAESGLQSGFDDASVVVMTCEAAILGRGVTYKDLCEVPDHLIAEILDGDLWVSPHPMPRHSHAMTMLAVALVPPFQHGNGGPGGWQLLVEVEVHFGGDVLVPDLAGWRSDRGLDFIERRA
jgi:hypothetical protein